MWKRMQGGGGRSSSSTPHKVDLSAIYELPFGTGKPLLNKGGVLTQLLGRWQVSSSMTAYSGFPFTVTSSGTSLNAPGNPQTADQVKSTVEIYGAGAPSPHVFPWMLDEIGPLEGLHVLHLQCHFGMDTLELARRGAATVTGLDFSGEAVARATALAAEVGLADRASARPATLSGGEQQRVAIARAVIARPELLVADEPTGNVDPEMAKRLIHLFDSLNKLGATVIVATHDLHLLSAVPRAEMIRLDRGQIADPTGALRHPPRKADVEA